MDTNQTNKFQHARRFERDLNERQREILARIAKGQTNAEIAAALDMTFDGAKWNVSEILTKLGLSSREEAADYWRWRQGLGSRARSALRALVPAGMPMKLVAGGGLAAIAVVVVVAAVLLWRDGGNQGPGPALAPFRLTATSVQMDGGSEFVSTHTTEWMDARHYRTTAKPDLADAHEVVLIADGQSLWQHIPDLQQYARADIPQVSFDQPLSRLFYRLYGPMAGARSVDELLRELRAEPDFPDPDEPRYANVIGDDVLLGLPVVIIEYGPISNDGMPDKLAAGWEIHSDGSGTVWINPETMIILRNEAKFTNGLSFRTEVTSLELGARFDEGDFAFKPGPDAQEIPAGQAGLPVRD